MKPLQSKDEKTIQVQVRALTPVSLQGMVVADGALKRQAPNVTIAFSTRHDVRRFSLDAGGKTPSCWMTSKMAAEDLYCDNKLLS